MKPLMQVLTLSLTLSGLARIDLAAEPAIRFVTEEHQVKVYIGDHAVVDYVFADSEISRPYFAQIRTLSGKQVSRNHPPREGVDS